MMRALRGVSFGVLALASSACGDKHPGPGGGPHPPALTDPGTEPWLAVPDEQVRAVCSLDPDALRAADQLIDAPYAVIRHGRLCHSFRAEGMAPEEAFSTTKTLGALVTGMVAFRSKNLPKSGRKTGPLSDLDPVGFWLDSFTYNPEARVGHVLAMVAHNADLSLGQRSMVYDVTGGVQINSLSDILNTVIAQSPAELGADLDQFAARNVFERLGMRDSSWGTSGEPNKAFAYSWRSTVLDMARVGLLMLNGGVWQGERLVDSEWVYRMTHPAFEDANTAYGYLTWVNAASNYHFGGLPVAPDWAGVQHVPRLPGPCAPLAVYRTHPHGLSDAPDCNYDSPEACALREDDGVWQAIGLLGQVIQGHPGLDLLLVAKELPSDDVGVTAPAKLWDAVRPALVAADPEFHGDESAFCRAYGANEYAPDLRSR